MKNIKKQIRKELSNKLVSAAMIHLDGLKKQKQKKIVRYLESKMGSVANYYMCLLKKKANRDVQFAAPEGEREITKLSEESSTEIQINSEIVNLVQ